MVRKYFIESFSNFIWDILKHCGQHTSKHAPIKKRYVRANQVSFMYSKIYKEVIGRTRLRNKFIDTKTDADRRTYSNQHNYCVSLIRKERMRISVILKYVTQRTIKPFGEK